MEVWNGIWKKIIVWNGIWNEDIYYGMEKKWKKIARMEYGKIVFHSIPCPARAPSIQFLPTDLKMPQQ